MKLAEKLPKEYLEGLKAGLKIAKDVAEKQGYEIHFPNLEDMRLEKDE